MSTSKETVAEILDTLAPLNVRARAMFGEFGLYCDEKIVALICDDTLFLKPSPVSGEILGECETAPPYPGAKDYYVVDQERVDDAEWLRDVVQQTADALPAPKPKVKKQKP
ncbi:MAG TPA: TfoX/Sxy family protein [Thermomicrobiales bacterium]|nr:TfoX/Sxy family protein [Thermomicrobiales bacterium]